MIGDWILYTALSILVDNLTGSAQSSRDAFAMLCGSAAQPNHSHAANVYRWAPDSIDPKFGALGFTVVGGRILGYVGMYAHTYPKIRGITPPTPGEPMISFRSFTGHLL
jgi:hypothetical protein